MPVVETILRWPLRVLALLLLGDALLVSLYHVDDLFAAHQGPGIWMALARSLNEGVLYPPLQDAGYYGGTRYTPLFFTLTAGLARVTPDYLVAVKLAALLSVIILVSGVAVAIRQTSGSWNEVPLAALLLAIPQVMSACVLPAADALSAGLAVWGLVVLGTEPTRQRVIWASLLFALGVWTKFSTLAGPAAAFFFCLGRLRLSQQKQDSPAKPQAAPVSPKWGTGGQAAWLVLCCTAFGLLLLGLTDWLSHGRFLDNLRALGGGGSGLGSALLAPARLLESIQLSQGFQVLLPLLGAVLIVRALRLGWSVWDWYFLTSLLFALLVYTSRGTAENHILELETAGVLLLARVVSTPTDLPGLERLLKPVLLVAALVVFLTGIRGHLWTWRAGEAEGLITKRQVEQAIPADARLLAEAPTIPVLRDQRPVVLDAFAFEILARTGKIDDAALAERIRRQEFDVLILLGRIDLPEQSLCPFNHFGPRVTDAMLDSYRFDHQLGTYFLFVPR